ncbi:glutathione S-transferase [Pararhizobium sp. IMCC21322]|uniref:glutathione S-transferase n=1 Tax=Pararhizobium sp. IMCC21322 TaxID=3067903 RepID=UPI002740C70D|nr:glutathione S-transferase [Pararhizobium sp. IMCC21322]
MSNLKLTYFDFAGSRGEEIRLAFAIAGVEFDDNRLSFEAFSKLKSDLPFGSMPVLEVKDHGVISQTNAILRLVGRQHGLHPKNLFEAVRHDELMEAVEELRQRISATMRIEDAAVKKAARQKLATDYIAHWGAGVEQLIGAGPFLAGEQPSVADIKLYMAHKWISSGGIDDIPTDIFDPFTKFKTLADGMRNHPAVLKWYSSET